MLKFSQGGSKGGGGYPSSPIYINVNHIIAVKPDSGLTKIVTTGNGGSNGAYSSFLINESIEEVVLAIGDASKNGAR